MSDTPTGDAFADLTNHFIAQANSQLSGAEHTHVGMALLAAAARFNVHVVAAATGSAPALKEEAPRALEFFTRRFEQAMQSNFVDYIENYDRLGA